MTSAYLNFNFEGIFKQQKTITFNESRPIRVYSKKWGDFNMIGRI